MRMNLCQVISGDGKTAEITAVYEGKTVTRHCVRTAAGLRGHHPDPEGVRSSKRAFANMKDIEAQIKRLKEDLENSGLNEEQRTNIEQRLAAVQEEFVPARALAKTLEDKFPEFVFYGG